MARAPSVAARQLPRKQGSQARKPSGAGAVMADRAPAAVEADDPRTALYRRLNFFPTPPWGARAGGELIARIDGSHRSCWEPACGQGHMVFGLRDYFAGGVFASDVYPHGFGAQLDFLDPAASYPGVGAVDWIVTNPPFSTAADFVRLGLERARRGVAVLARAGWFETEGRFDLFFGPRRLAIYAPFFDRLPMHLGRWLPRGGSATAYAWYVWVKAPELAAVWCGEPRVIPFPPGSKARLSRPDDVRLWGAPSAAPLLEGGR